MRNPSLRFRLAVTLPLMMLGPSGCEKADPAGSPSAESAGDTAESDPGFSRATVESNDPSPASRKVRIGGRGDERPTVQPSALDMIEVVVTGTGKTQEEAEKRALRSAVEQVVGTLVLAKDVVENDELIQSKVISVANGFVQKYESLAAPRLEAGQVAVRLRAWVKVSEVTKVLADNAIAVRGVDGKSLSARIATRKMRDEEAIAAVGTLFEDWPNKLLSVGIVYPDGESPRIVNELSDGGAVIEFWVQARIDPDKWSAWASEATRVLQACSLGTEEGWWSFQRDAVRLSDLMRPYAEDLVREEFERTTGMQLLSEGKGRSVGRSADFDPQAFAGVVRVHQLLGRTIPKEAWNDSYLLREIGLQPESKQLPGGVMVFPTIDQPAIQFKLSPPIVSQVKEAAGSSIPRVVVKLSRQDGGDVGRRLTNWEEVVLHDAQHSYAVWTDPSRLGTEWLKVESRGDRGFGAFFQARPSAETGTTISMFPALWLDQLEFIDRSSPPIYLMKMCATQLNFPFRFQLSKEELDGLDQISVELMAPGKPESRGRRPMGGGIGG